MSQDYGNHHNKVYKVVLTGGKFHRFYVDSDRPKHILYCSRFHHHGITWFYLHFNVLFHLEILSTCFS